MTGSYYFRQLDKAGQAAYHAMKTIPFGNNRGQCN